MKITVAGGGKVGRRLTRELSAEGHNITLIDIRPEILEEVLEMYDVITYQGNSASKTTLLEAGIEDMDVFIAATDMDEINMLSCITAKALNERVHTIARIRNPEYVEQAYSMRDTFRLSLVINPERQTAIEIAHLLKYPGFLKRESFAKARVEIVELKVQPDSKLAHVRLKNLSDVIHAKVLICTVVRDGEIYMPDGDFALAAGDRIFVTGDAKALHTLLKNTGAITHPVRHALIAGGSKIAYYLARELEKVRISTTIIDRDEKTCRLLAGKLPDTTIVHGDVSNHSVMDSEEVEEYDAFVSLTGLDELNIVASSYASLKKVPQVVTKIGREEDTKLLDMMPVGSVISPKELCTMHILRYVRAMNAKHGSALTIHKIADGHAEAIEFLVDEHTKHIGEPLKNLKIKKNMLINSISHGAKSEIPGGDSSFQLGDTVVVVAGNHQILYQMNDIFED